MKKAVWPQGKKKLHNFPTILGQGAPTFRNHFRQKKVYLYRSTRLEWRRSPVSAMCICVLYPACLEKLNPSFNREHMGGCFV